jgi:hypothetical protein
MRPTIEHAATWLAAAAIGGAVALSPVASADPGHTPVSPPKVAHHSTASSGPAQTPPDTGVDPLVPNTPGANPYVPDYPGMDRPF